MRVQETPLQGVRVLHQNRISDDRGFFLEAWNRRALAVLGIDIDFVQDNHSLSLRVGTVRGLHYQSPPHAQAKLVRVARGCAYDVVVDVRRGSPTFGAWYGTELSAENCRLLYVPEGFLHGFVTRQPCTELLYKCSDYYSPDHEGTIRFDDPDLAIDWGFDPATAILSAKDAAGLRFVEFDSPFVWEPAR